MCMAMPALKINIPSRGDFASKAAAATKAEISSRYAVQKFKVFGTENTRKTFQFSGKFF